MRRSGQRERRDAAGLLYGDVCVALDRPLSALSFLSFRWFKSRKSQAPVRPPCRRMRQASAASSSHATRTQQHRLGHAEETQSKGAGVSRHVAARSPTFQSRCSALGPSILERGIIIVLPSGCKQGSEPYCARSCTYAYGYPSPQYLGAFHLPELDTRDHG